MSPAVGDLVVVLGLVIENITGKPLGAFVAEQVANLAAKIARELMAGEIPKIATEMGKQIGEIVGAVASIIPIIAAAVEIALDVIEAMEKQLAARLEGMTQRALDRCKNSYVTTKGTGLGGAITPADLFRPIYEMKQRGPISRKLLKDGKAVVKDGKFVYTEYGSALTVASLFCAICGPESPLGWSTDMRTKWIPPPGYPSAAGATTKQYIVSGHGNLGYRQFIHILHKRPATKKVGLPTHQRRRIATIIEGIMGSVRPWTLEKIPQVGDQGRSLFPVLCDVLLQAWRDGLWNVPMLQALQRSQIGCYNVTDYQTGERIGPVIDLSGEFVGLIMAWKNTVEAASADYGPAHTSYLTSKRLPAKIKVPSFVHVPVKKRLLFVSTKWTKKKKLPRKKKAGFRKAPAKDKPSSAAPLVLGAAAVLATAAAVAATRPWRQREP